MPTNIDTEWEARVWAILEADKFQPIVLQGTKLNLNCFMVCYYNASHSWVQDFAIGDSVCHCRNKFCLL